MSRPRCGWGAGACPPGRRTRARSTRLSAGSAGRRSGSETIAADRGLLDHDGRPGGTAPGRSEHRFELDPVCAPEAIEVGGAEEGAGNQRRSGSRQSERAPPRDAGAAPAPPRAGGRRPRAPRSRRTCARRGRAARRRPARRARGARRERSARAPARGKTRTRRDASRTHARSSGDRLPSRYPATSSCRVACSVTGDRAPLQLFPEGAESVVRPRLDGAERHSEACCDLRLGHVAQVVQLEDLTMLGREGVERIPNVEAEEERRRTARRVRAPPPRRRRPSPTSATTGVGAGRRPPGGRA